MSLDESARQARADRAWAAAGIAGVVSALLEMKKIDAPASTLARLQQYIDDYERQDKIMDAVLAGDRIDPAQFARLVHGAKA